MLKRKIRNLVFQSLWRALDNALFIFFKVNWGEQHVVHSINYKKIKVRTRAFFS